MYISPLKWHFCLHGEPENYFLNTRSIYHICTLIHCHCMKLINTGQSCFYRKHGICKNVYSSGNKQTETCQSCGNPFANKIQRKEQNWQSWEDTTATPVTWLTFSPSSITHVFLCWKPTLKGEQRTIIRSSVEQQESIWVTGRGTYLLCHSCRACTKPFWTQMDWTHLNSTRGNYGVLPEPMKPAWYFTMKTNKQANTRTQQQEQQEQPTIAACTQMSPVTTALCWAVSKFITWIRIKPRCVLPPSYFIL